MLTVLNPTEAENSLASIASLFNTQAIDNKIILKKDLYSGIIQLHAYSDVFAWHWNIHSTDAIKNMPLCSESGNRITLAYCLTTDNVELEEQKKTGQIYITHAQYISFNILPGNVKLLVLEVSAEWLRLAYKDDPGVSALIDDILHRPHSVELLQQFSAPLAMSLSFAYDHLLRNPADVTYIKTRFLSFFYDALQINCTDKEKPGKPVDRHIIVRMQEAEKIILQHLLTDLPSLDTISKQLGISSSTLKRNFVKVYGMPVYDFYLKRKLAIAWQYLFEKEMPVKETAYMLGYENVSSFITIFKKHFHCLPGDVKRSKQKLNMQEPGIVVNFHGIKSA